MISPEANDTYSVYYYVPETNTVSDETLVDFDDIIPTLKVDTQRLLSTA